MKYTFILIFFFFVIETGNTQTTKWKVIWNQNPENDIKEYIVYKDNKETARVKSPDTVYVDKDIQPGILYSYRIRAVNEKNIAGDYSDPATAAIPEFKNLAAVLGISKNKPTELLLKDFINDPDDMTHEIKRKNIAADSKISVTLESGNLLFTAKASWTEQDTENVEIEVIDSDSFSNVAIITIKDESKLSITLPQNLDLKVFPEEFSLSQYSKITISNIPPKSNISIYDSFSHLVFSEKNISKKFEWDAENNQGDQVLFGMYNYFIYDKNNNIISEGYFRVIP